MEAILVPLASRCALLGTTARLPTRQRRRRPSDGTMRVPHRQILRTPSFSILSRFTLLHRRAQSTCSLLNEFGGCLAFRPSGTFSPFQPGQFLDAPAPIEFCTTPLRNDAELSANAEIVA